jgi:hypothetical protein
MTHGCIPHQLELQMKIIDKLNFTSWIPKTEDGPGLYTTQKH